ncbi:hypothetical protein [Nakamurella sp.]
MNEGETEWSAPVVIDLGSVAESAQGFNFGVDGTMQDVVSP